MTESHQSFLQDYYPRRQCASQRTYCTPRIHASVTLLPTSPYLLTSHSPVQPSSMFATTHRAPDQDYPSPAPSIPSPGPHPHHPQIDHYANYSQPSPIISGVSNENSALSFVQTESSIGPTRVRTRRQASLQQNLLGRRPQSASNMSRHEQGHYDPGAHLHAQSAMASRSRTPSGGSCSGSNYQPSNLDRLEINMASAVPMQMQSPYHPITPTSLSPYSPYEHRVHSRSTSGSTNFDARPASPALSIASNYTAASSAVHYTSTSKEPAPDKHKKARLTPLDRKAICLHAAQFPNQRQEDVARHFQVERSTISKILKSKERWLAVQDGTEHTAKHRPSKFPQIEAKMADWIQECDENNINMTDNMIKNKARDIAKDFHIGDDRFKASAGWIENFKHRYSISRGVWALGKVSQRPGNFPADDTIPGLAPISPSSPYEDDHMDQLPSASMSTRNGLEESHNVPHASDSMGHDNASHNASGPAHSPPVSWAERSHSTSNGSEVMHESPSHSPVLPQSSEPTMHLTVSTHKHVDPNHVPPPHAYHEPVAYENVAPEMYPPPPEPPIPDNSPPTIDDAENAINRLIAFIDTAPHEIIRPDEREVLNTIKCALFQYASGVPFERTR